ncbi:MAG: hypothetical protein AAGK79_15975 [Pseudomonadota bacterium]
MNNQTLKPPTPHGHTDPRESFSGRILTDTQYGEAQAISGILHAEIHNSGTFKEKLGDYAHAFARTNRFDASRAETTLRDIFRAQHGMTMNEMREGLAAQEDQIRLDDPTVLQVKHAVSKIGTQIAEGDKINFNRAYSENAQGLAAEFGITNAGAKRLMVQVHRDETGGELYDWGKQLEDEHYRPQIEAERAERGSQSRSSQSSGSQSRSSEAGEFETASHTGPDRADNGYGQNQDGGQEKGASRSYGRGNGYGNRGQNGGRQSYARTGPRR